MTGYGQPAALVPASHPLSALAAQPRGLQPDRNPAIVYLSRLAAGASRSAMTQALARAAECLTGTKSTALALPWHELSYAHSAALRARLIERYRPSTVNQTLAAVRGVLREAWRLGLMDAETYQRAADVRDVRVFQLPAGRALTAGEISALFRVCEGDEGAARARDAAIVALLYGGGLRRFEAVQTDLADWTRRTPELRVRSGKGRKDRLVFMLGGSDVWLERWLRFRSQEPGPLLAAVLRGGQVRTRRLTTQALYYALRRLAEQAGVELFSPHDLRRTFVTALLAAGADVPAVRSLAGHSRLDTKARYDRRGEAACRKAAALVELPVPGSRTPEPRPAVREASGSLVDLADLLQEVRKLEAALRQATEALAKGRAAHSTPVEAWRDV